MINPLTETCPHAKSHGDDEFDGLPQEQNARNSKNNGCLFESSCSACEKGLSMKMNCLKRNHEKKTCSIGNMPCFLVNILGQKKMHVSNFVCVRISMLLQAKMMIAIHNLTGVPLDLDE